MTSNEIRAAFATIANNTNEDHTREFALEQFRKIPVARDLCPGNSNEVGFCVEHNISNPHRRDGTVL